VTTLGPIISSIVPVQKNLCTWEARPTLPDPGWAYGTKFPAWAREPVRLGRIGLMALSMEIFLRRLVEPSPGAVCVWAMLAVGLMALPLDERAPSVGGDVAQGGGPAGVGFSHVEDLLTAVTPDCLLHLSALTRPRAQDEGSNGAPLRLFADLVERRTDVSQNAQRQL